MFKCGQIVLDMITKKPVVILNINYMRKKVRIFDIDTLQQYNRNLHDLGPWDPPSGGGAAIPGVILSEDDVNSLISLLERHHTLADPGEIEYKTNEEQIAFKKVKQLHESLFSEKIQVYM